MNSLLQRLKQVLILLGKVFLFSISFIFCVLVFVLLILPLGRGWWLRHELLTALDQASSVKVVEHSCRWDSRMTSFSDYKEITYASVMLSPSQIESLRDALPIRLDISGAVMTKCIFEEHHYIEITQKDGSVLTLHICFHCGEIELNGEDQRIMPWG